VTPNTLLATEMAKEPTWCFVAEFLYSRHSTKSEPLPSITVTLDTVSVAVTWRLSFVEYLVTLGKVFTECLIKSTRQRNRFC
jgi:hypothetical protein